MRRRELLKATLLGGCALTASGLSCDPAPKHKPAKGGPLQSPWRGLDFPPGDVWRQRQYAAVRATAGKALPLLVALHGRGEAGRGLQIGARGWRDDYELERAHQRLKKPPLVAEDLHGFVRPKRLEQLNASLRNKPFGGLSVACPYTPALPDRSLVGSRPFADFVTNTLLPKVRKQLALGPAERARTGIDGVSMGGRLSLLVGLSHPEIFGGVGALQPAIGVSEAGWLAQLAAKSASRGKQALRLVSSTSDPFLAAVKAFSTQLNQKGVAHQLLITPGPHDYVWNRGPGSFEMLLWHDRVLRGLPAV